MQNQVNLFGTIYVKKTSVSIPIKHRGEAFFSILLSPYQIILSKKLFVNKTNELVDNMAMFSNKKIKLVKQFQKYKIHIILMT